MSSRFETRVLDRELGGVGVEAETGTVGHRADP